MIKQCADLDQINEPVDTYCQKDLGLTNYVPARKLYPILKWAGGKEQELKYIIPNLPNSFENFYEPFVGGGAVYTAISATHYFINDKSDELILLYKSIRGCDTVFFDSIAEIIHNWELLSKVVDNNITFFLTIYRQYAAEEISEDKFRILMFGFIMDNSEQFNGMFSERFNFKTSNFLNELRVNVARKTKRMKELEQVKGSLSDDDIAANIETALKSAFYMHFRHIYNRVSLYKVSEPIKAAIFFFIRNFAYSGMFRYNASGDFNVPYGGIGYNRKKLERKVEYLKSKALQELLSTTTIENLDFEEFLGKYNPNSRDFVFLDPPYDSEFSTYANNEFNKTDQKRLANYLINNCKAKWMMIIKNTDFIKDLYSSESLNIRAFDKSYLVSFMNRNDKDVEHLMITNY